MCWYWLLGVIGLIGWLKYVLLQVHFHALLWVGTQGEDG